MVSLIHPSGRCESAVVAPASKSLGVRLTMCVRPVVVCSMTLVLGCASAPWRHERVGITSDELLAGAPLGGEEDSPALVDQEEVLAVSPEMQDFLDAHVSRRAAEFLRLRRLGQVILDEGTFGLEYDETTRTASKTFEARRGNCLSFSNMFVAMARNVGLEAHFQEVDIPPDWSFENETFVLNRHVNVVVDPAGGVSRRRVRLGSLIGSRAEANEHVVDFNMDDFRASYDRRRISDARALAHFYNNMAVERMQVGDTASALSYFRMATGSDPEFSPAWTNLGTLYMRKSHSAHAEAAYLQALRADERDFVAISNLARLYERRGDRERATRYRRRVSYHRSRNPYYRLQLAREAFDSQDYDAAIDHLKYAVRKKKNEDQFYYLLGLSYMKKGDEKGARRWLSRAEEVAATDVMKHRYASKIGILLSGLPDQSPPQ